MNQRMLRCEEALRLLADFLDHELDQVERQAVTTHLDTCRTCFSRAEFEKRLKAQLGELRQEPVGTTLEARIRSVIHHFESAPPSDAATD